jgi:hypothetical protein
LGTGRLHPHRSRVRVLAKAKSLGGPSMSFCLTQYRQPREIDGCEERIL